MFAPAYVASGIEEHEMLVCATPDVLETYLFLITTQVLKPSAGFAGPVWG